MSKPGTLALGVAPGLALTEFQGLGERNFSRGMAHQRAQSDGLGGGQVGIEAERGKLSRLVDCACLDHGGEPGIDRRI